MRYDEDNALKDQGNRQGFTAAPLNAMECEKGKVHWEVFLAIKRKYPLQRPKLSLPYTRLKQYAVLWTIV